MTFNFTEVSTGWILIWTLQKIMAAQLGWLLYTGDFTTRVSQSCIFISCSWYSYYKLLALNLILLHKQHIIMHCNLTLLLIVTCTAILLILHPSCAACLVINNKEKIEYTFMLNNPTRYQFPNWSYKWFVCNRGSYSP